MQYDYKKEIDRSIDSTQMTLMKKRIRQTDIWKTYTKYFLAIVNERKENYLKDFNEYLIEKSRLLLDQIINEQDFKPEKDLEKHVENYKKSKSFEIEFEQSKYDALKEFIQEKIFSQQIKTEKEPSKESIKVLNDFIREKKNDLKNDSNYKGLHVE